jgi:hypothetical protein
VGIHFNHKVFSELISNKRDPFFALEMGRIVQSMLDSGLTVEIVMKRLKMEREEVIRLTNTQGVMGHPDIDKPYSKAWEPQ